MRNQMGLTEARNKAQTIKAEGQKLACPICKEEAEDIIPMIQILRWGKCPKCLSVKKEQADIYDNKSLASKLSESLPLEDSRVANVRQRILDAKTFAERIPTKEQFLKQCGKCLNKNGIRAYDLHRWLIARLTGEKP